MRPRPSPRARPVPAPELARRAALVLATSGLAGLLACADAGPPALLGPAPASQLVLASDAIELSVVPMPEGSYHAFWLDGVNAHGHAVGTVHGEDPEHWTFYSRAIYWDGSAVEVLPGAEGPWSSSGAIAIDSRGRILGGIDHTVVLWEKVAGQWTITPLGLFSAYAMNDHGLVLGGIVEGGLIVPYILDVETGLGQRLPRPAPPSWVNMRAINGHGHAFGTVTPSTVHGAAVWRGGDDWEPLPRDPSWQAVEAGHFNDRGQAVGTAWPPIDGRLQGVFWDGDEIRNLTTEQHFHPRHIDNAGRILGTYRPPGEPAAPAIREPDGTIHLLLPPSGRTVFFGAIADGWAVGYDSFSAGFVWKLPPSGDPAGCAPERVEAELDDAVAAGDIAPDDARSLRAPLRAAIAARDRGQLDAARRALGAFANQVRALERSRRIDAATAARLTGAAETAADGCVADP